MKYYMLPFLMWLIFKPSFRKELTNTFAYDEKEARAITAKAKIKYKELIFSLPELKRKTDLG